MRAPAVLCSLVMFVGCGGEVSAPVVPDLGAAPDARPPRDFACRPCDAWPACGGPCGGDL